jgi:sulfur transfer complex TusBCD TusB component (DsrH family)
MDHDVVDLIEKRKMTVYVIAEDVADRGIERSALVPGVELISRSGPTGIVRGARHRLSLVASSVSLPTRAKVVALHTDV